MKQKKMNFLFSEFYRPLEHSVILKENENLWKSCIWLES